MFPLHAFDVSFQAIEALLPGGNMLAYPGFGLMKGVQLDPAGSDAANFLGTDEPALLKNTHMFEE